MSDLLNTLGKKKDAPAAKVPDTSETPGESIIGGTAPSDGMKRGDNLISQAAGTGTKEADDAAAAASAAQAEADAKAKMVKNPDDWTKESALTEVIKLREENKIARVKFQEAHDRLNKEKEAEIAKIKEEAQSAGEAKKKLEALEAAAEDKKRTLEDKLAHREGRLAEVETVYTQKLKEKDAELAKYKSQAEMYAAQQAAQQQVYKDRIKEEMATVPEEFKQFAERMVKGFEDPAEAWTALSEAKMKGMFGEKKIVVNHAVPGANDGARTSRSKIEQQEREDKKSKTSKDLIRSGLDKIIKGNQPNSAFRTR